MVMMIIVSMNCKSVDEDARISKGSSCSFKFCPNEEGGGPCPIFLSTCHKLYILGQFGDGEGGGDPCPIFFAHRRSRKVVQVVQIRGGVEVVWTKSKRTMQYQIRFHFESGAKTK